jgi:UDP-N-acetylmuramoyl-tripeptide--D-alanyl-D-alanine ligase
LKHSHTAALTIRDLINWGKAESSLSSRIQKQAVGAIWMDSRKVTAGDIFVALRGEGGADGHAFVKAALGQGAVAAIVARTELAAHDITDRSRLIATADPLKALHRMALHYRRRLNIPIIAVTGSNGKTTTRRFIAAVLRSRFAVGETGGNWNNHIGVPLTILRMDGRERIGVLEMAANHSGEIHELTKTARPDIAVITNIGYAHIGNFGSLAGTTRAKFEIADGLDTRNGFMLLNGDDQRLVAEARRRGLAAVYFGFSSRCDVRAQKISIDANGASRFIVDGQEYRLAMPGRHFIYNALPAIALGRHFGMSGADVADTLVRVEPESLRGRIAVKQGVRFIVDCYNANPSSMRSGVQLLNDVAAGKRMKAIIGDMRELGKYTAPQHRALGRRIARMGMHSVIVVGEHAHLVADGAVAAGMPPRRINCVPDADAALRTARTALKPGDTVLLKGSRAVGLEQVFERW